MPVKKDKRNKNVVASLIEGFGHYMILYKKRWFYYRSG